MSTLTRDQIKSAALGLDPVEREALAEELLLSIDGKGREAIDRAWLEELDRRDQALAEGKSSVRPMEEVLDRLAHKGKK